MDFDNKNLILQNFYFYFRQIVLYLLGINLFLNVFSISGINRKINPIL